MKKLIKLSIFLLSISSISIFATPRLVPLSSNCTDNANLFLNINTALGEKTSLTEYAGFVNIGDDYSFDDTAFRSGDNQPLIQAYGNTTCLKQEGVTRIILALTGVTTA